PGCPMSTLFPYTTLFRSFERAGLRVGFCKLVEQNHPSDKGPERSTELIENTFGIQSPTPIAFSVAQKMLAEGRGDEVLEEGIRLFHQAAKDKDVMVVEGIVPTREEIGRASCRERGEVRRVKGK